ncbi:hypothetical protein BDP55DRAFT_277269 [Colletotrichum godetiae]|uniref:Uncharacterized protein n=1 Tax=Colletotrichum godetiae TaxID=1209918 RepID=A0AAJ0AGJ9_9PEZI|nr:uncharacterized protein BDP55DRAFT_277269 [Colletotrichum godetiae]KAK1672043.1 hypothetical protein BDP55DRAFT_277269 [Colletotrichum godetiae]
MSQMARIAAVLKQRTGLSVTVATGNGTWMSLNFAPSDGSFPSDHPVVSISCFWPGWLPRWLRQGHPRLLGHMKSTKAKDIERHVIPAEASCGQELSSENPSLILHSNKSRRMQNRTIRPSWPLRRKHSAAVKNKPRTTNEDDNSQSLDLALPTPSSILMDDHGEGGNFLCSTSAHTYRMSWHSWPQRQMGNSRWIVSLRLPSRVASRQRDNVDWEMARRQRQSVSLGAKTTKFQNFQRLWKRMARQCRTQWTISGPPRRSHSPPEETPH